MIESKEEVESTFIISQKARKELLEKYQSKFAKDPFLSRKIVSFQANKTNPIYRWFKYKEGFSSNLVQYYINKFELSGKRVLDPFAGTGTTLFASSSLGCDAVGIELLPVGIFYMRIREILPQINLARLERIRSKLWDNVDNQDDNNVNIFHVPITDGAFPVESERHLNKYLTYVKTLPKAYSKLFQFVAFSTLESISYTRKDGQYLRWDYRSNRTAAKTKFNKGTILDFKTAIDRQLTTIIEDLKEEIPSLSLFPKIENIKPGTIEIIQGSCLKKLRQIEPNSIDIVITSPPYCNRYDYTRTYALELVFLGCNNEEIKDLRQEMLSCTVENKSKEIELQEFYSKEKDLEGYHKVFKVFKESEAMNEIIEILNHFKEQKVLNNSGIVRMIRNYFLEMCFTLYELSKTIKSGGRVIMVNDNVKYNGEEIPVDLLLSDFASHFGLETDKIFVLDQNKGNSSQQMGAHGRTPLRKCVYSWKKV